jgi:hypothetical protein
LGLIQKSFRQEAIEKYPNDESTNKVPTKIYGIDFTSAPRKAKAITVAHASLENAMLNITHVERLESFAEFEAFLNVTGPWVAGFDFPFGLPHELVATLDWPQTWRELVKHVHAIGKDAFKTALDELRTSRPTGSKYIERRGDSLAGSSSPMKLVNPPVALMFFEGAVRLACSGVSVVPCAPNASTRIALEAYPGFLVRQITRDSYKKDGRDGNTRKRVAARERIVSELPAFAKTTYALDVVIANALCRACIDDGSGDTLDAVLCAVQAATAQRAFEAGDLRYGIPKEADDFEGWIATVGWPKNIE